MVIAENMLPDVGLRHSLTTLRGYSAALTSQRMPKKTKRTAEVMPIASEARPV